MKSGTRIGLAVGLGYVLGRRRKLRTALTLAAAVAAGRMSRDPAGLRKLGGALPGASHLGGLGRLGAPLVGAGRSAAVAAAGSGIDALSGKLRGQADALRRRTGGGGGGDQRDEASDGEQSSGNDGGKRERGDQGASAGNSTGQRGW